MSPIITIDDTVKTHRSNVTALEKERTAFQKQIKELDTQLAALPDMAELQRKVDDANGELAKASGDFAALRLATQNAHDAYKKGDDELQEARIKHATLKTLLQIADPKGGIVSEETFRAAVGERPKDLLKELKAKVEELAKDIPLKEKAVQALQATWQTAQTNEVAGAETERKAREKRDLAVVRKQERVDLEAKRGPIQASEQAKAKEIDAEKAVLDLAKSDRNLMLDRVPAGRPDYLRVTVGGGVVDENAQHVLQELEASHQAFMAHRHVKTIKQKVVDYGIVGSVVAITDLINRMKDKPVKRRILAATYAYTLASLIAKVEAEAGGLTDKEPGGPKPADADKVREAFGDRTAFANRIRHFQQEGLTGVDAPQAIFAERFLEVVATKVNKPLPAAGTARRTDLVNSMVANLS